MITHSDLIKHLGGAHALARQVRERTGLRISPQAVWQWKTGVPWRWRPLVAEMAHERGLDLPEDFLLPRREAAHG